MGDTWTRLGFLGVLLVLSVGVPPPAHSQGLTREKLEAIKRATVYLRVFDQLRESRGSGFVIERNDSQGLIVTNAHVAAPKRGSGISRLEVVLNSGLPDERVVGAKLLGVDEAGDLAMLSVRAENLPEPIRPAGAPDFYETMPILIFGFPFGEALAGSTGRPEITASRGTISSLRRDDFGRLTTVQIDGSINAGNSGGPLVNEAGELVGIAMAHLAGSQIGFAVPVPRLQEMRLGRVGGVKLTRRGIQDGRMQYDVNADLIDPLERIKEVTLWTIRSDEAPQELKPGADGRFAQISPAMTAHRLQVSSGSATGRISVPVSPRSEAEAGISMHIQVGYVSRDAQPRFTDPAVFNVHRVHGQDAIVASADIRSLALATRNPQRTPATPDKEITSPTTRVQPTEPNQPLLPFPKPESSSDVALRWDSMHRVEEFRSLALTASATPANDRTRNYATAVWSSDGQALFIVDGVNVLRRYSVGPQPVETAHVKIDAVCPDMAFSREGLVVALLSGSALWVVNPETLEVIREISVESPRCVAAAPSSSLACTVGRSFNVVNLQRGEVIHRVPLDREHPVASGIFDGTTSLRMSPDGKSIFAGSGDLTRLTIEGEDVRVADQHARLSNGARRVIALSPDGKYIAYPSGGGNPSAGGSYRTSIFRSDNLTQQALVIDNNAYPAAVDLDPVSGRIYGSNGRAVQVFSPRGGKLFEFDPPGQRGGEIRRIIVSPAGGKFLLWQEQQVSVIETRSTN